VVAGARVWSQAPELPGTSQPLHPAPSLPPGSQRPLSLRTMPHSRLCKSFQYKSSSKAASRYSDASVCLKILFRIVIVTSISPQLKGTIIKVLSFQPYSFWEKAGVSR